MKDNKGPWCLASVIYCECDSYVPPIRAAFGDKIIEPLGKEMGGFFVFFFSCPKKGTFLTLLKSTFQFSIYIFSLST